MDLVIREALQKDFDGIFKLLLQLWPDLHLDFDKLHKVYLIGVNSVVQHYLVVESDQKIVGFCSLTIKNNLWQAGSLGHIDELVIEKHHRGKGFGLNLIEAITSVAKNNGCKRIELDSAFQRKGAHNFYEKLGYTNRAYLFSKQLDV